MRWDIFCKVIDNHGDIGVCWRLSAELASRGDTVRLFVDDASALAWMAPGGCAGVTVLPWAAARGMSPSDAVVEAFGCELEDAFQGAMARETVSHGGQPAWFNLEYLSAEAYVERCHGLPSPVMAGPAAGLTKRFFYPGFTARTGGLLREQSLAARQAAFDRAAWLQRHGIEPGRQRLVSLFCYEPPGLAALLRELVADGGRTRLLVTHGRAAAAVRRLLDREPELAALPITWLPLLPQPEFDHLLWACNLNFVRGEDSLVRAIWAGRPFVWQIYPQDDGAHVAKLDAFLDSMAAPAGLRRMHAVWNHGGTDLPALELAAWGEASQVLSARLEAAVPELATALRASASTPQP